MIATSVLPKPSQKKRLLVIDDEQSICEFVRRVAEGQGFEVVTAHTREQFKTAYDSFQPSAILFDLTMPQIDGVALMEALAEKHCTAHLMIMSGYHPELLKSSSRLGNGYSLDVRGTLRKPFGVAELRAALHWLN